MLPHIWTQSMLLAANSIKYTNPNNPNEPLHVTTGSCAGQPGCFFQDVVFTTLESHNLTLVSARLNDSALFDPAEYWPSCGLCGVKNYHELALKRQITPFWQGAYMWDTTPGVQWFSSSNILPLEIRGNFTFRQSVRGVALVPDVPSGQPSEPSGQPSEPSGQPSEPSESVASQLSDPVKSVARLQKSVTRRTCVFATLIFVIAGLLVLCTGQLGFQQEQLVQQLQTLRAEHEKLAEAQNKALKSAESQKKETEAQKKETKNQKQETEARKSDAESQKPAALAALAAEAQTFALGATARIDSLSAKYVAEAEVYKMFMKETRAQLAQLAELSDQAARANAQAASQESEAIQQILEKVRELSVHCEAMANDTRGAAVVAFDAANDAKKVLQEAEPKKAEPKKAEPKKVEAKGVEAKEAKLVEAAVEAAELTETEAAEAEATESEAAEAADIADKIKLEMEESDESDMSEEESVLVEYVV